MPNIAAIFKAETARIARKEMRAEADRLKSAIATQRSELANLKRVVGALQKELRSVSRELAKQTKSLQAGPAAQPDKDATEFRFSARGLASNRKRLGLSAEDFGLLVGTSGQSVYLWESGRSKPRTSNLAALASLRTLGKREAAARLADMRSET
jgi:DNA-binding transcriptional regulator YiaG